MRSRALLAKLPRPDASKLDRRIRRCVQWSPSGEPNLVRYDFAFRDPASGAVRQFCAEALTFSEDRANWAVTMDEPCRRSIARSLHSQCGIDEALRHQIWLELPRTADAKEV